MVRRAREVQPPRHAGDDGVELDAPGRGRVGAEAEAGAAEVDEDAVALVDAEGAGVPVTARPARRPMIRMRGTQRLCER